MALSPICQVNNATPPQSVGAGATVEIELLTPAGADFWGIVAIGTDELSSVAAVNASLVVNQITKKATFTAPAGLGSAVVFQSTVGVANSGSSQGAGIDANGVTQPSFTTTFKVNVPTSNGLHVIAVNEVVEENGSFGWIAEQNACIRAASGASVPVLRNYLFANAGTPGGVYQFTGLLSECGSLLSTDSTGGVLTGLKLPAAPSTGWYVDVEDSTQQWAAHSLSVNGNGHNVLDPNTIGSTGTVTTPVTLNKIGATVRITWNGTIFVTS